MNYKKRDDELIKLNKQVQNMKNSATNKSLSSQKSGTYGSTRKEVPYVKPNKASEMNTPGTTKPSTRYQNQTAGQTAPKKTRDTRYDKDFDEFHKYRLGDFSGAMDYDPVTDTSTEHWRTMKNDLMKKHGWSEEEFDTRWNSYNDERNKKASEQEVQTAVKTAKDNAILGTALQAMYTPQTWIEGGASMLSNLLPEKYKAQSADAANFTGIRTKEATKQAVKDEHIKGDGLLAKAGRGAYDVGTSLVDMALASGVPVLGAATMGAETAARTNMEALERGASANRAAATAGISGLISGAMNKIGLDKAAGAEAKTALGKVIKGAGVEAAENMLEDSANLAVDTLINTDKSQLSALHDYYTSQGLDDKSAWNRVMLDTARDMAVSGVSGAAFGGVMNGLHNLPSLIPEVRDLTKGLKMNDVGGVDAPALLEEARAAMKAPAKVGNKLEFEPVEGEIRDKLQAEFDANTEQISKNETEIATLRELETTGSKRNQNRYKKQREALEKENRVLEGQQPELRKMLDGYRSTFKGELSKEDANAIFDDRNGGVNNWLNLGVKFAGETDEAKALRKEAKKAIRAYVESGNIDDWHNAVKYIGDLSNLADEARIPYRTQDGKVYNYEDVFDSAETDYLGRPVQGTMFDKIYNGNTVPNIVNALHERIVPRVEGEPNRIPEPTGESAPEIPNVVEESAPTMDPAHELAERYASAFHDFDTYDDMDNMLENEGFVEQMARDISEGKDLTPYIEAIENVIEDAPDVDTRTNMIFLIDRLDKINAQNEGVTFNTDNETNRVPQLTPEEQAEIQNELAEEYDWTDNRVPEGTQPTSENIPPTNEPPTVDSMIEPPIVVGDKDLRKESRVGTHSTVNSGIFTEDQVHNDPVISELNKYIPKNEQESYDNALMNVAQNGDELLDDYINGKRTIDNERDVDQSMILLTMLSNRLDAGDTSVTAQRNLLFGRLRKAGTKYGQTIQAFAKWNRTADGATINSEGLIGDTVRKWKDKNVKSTELNGRIAEALKKLGYDGSMDKEPTVKTHEQIREGVKNVIEREFGSIEGLFSDKDIDVLTNWAEEGVPTWKITDEIEHFLNHGEWYTLDESTPVKKAFSSKLEGILKKMGDDTPKPIDNGYPKKSFSTILEEVRNTLGKEMAGLGLDDTADAEHIATMIEDGASNWQIEKEITHRLETGEWNDFIRPLNPVNQRLKNAFDSLVPREETVKEPLTLDEIKQQVEYIVNNEIPGVCNETDIEYLANFINEGATKEELADALNTKMATGSFGVSAETQQAVSEMFRYADSFPPNSKKAYDLRTAAYKMLANEAVSEDASAFEKFDSWRYLAMLGNPKTWVRNKIGNEMFNVVTGISNNLSVALEVGADKAYRAMGGEGIQRTKAFLNPVDDHSLIKAAADDGDNYRYSELQGSKYERGVKDAIKQQKSVFNSKALRTYEAITDWGVSDYKNVKRKYGTSLAGWMKANGMDESDFELDARYNDLLKKSRSQLLTDAEKTEMNTLKAVHDKLEKGRDYAVEQAEYATFHEPNVMASLISKHISDARRGTIKINGKEYHSPVAKLYGLSVEGMLPFKRTPANILKSGFEYSPFGAIKSVAETGKLIYENTGKRKGNLADSYTVKGLLGGEHTVYKTKASEMLDSWSKTLTGSGLMLLGMFLKDNDILNSSTKDEEYQDQLEGKQNYSITINGHTYTLDWAAPGVMPLLMGAELSKIKDRNLLLNKKWYDNASELLSTVNAILDPMFETSMLSGVKDTIKAAADTFKYSDKEDVGGGILGSLAANMATGYVTQAIPTLSGQIARTVDNTRRTTDTIKDQKNDPYGYAFEKQMRKQMNKIPGLSRMNQPYYDSYGRTDTNGPKNPLGNLAYQMLSPGYLEKINTTEADRSARNAYYSQNEDGDYILDKGVFPSWKSKVTVNGEKYTPEQMATYRKTSGEAQYGIRDALAKEDWFNNLNGEKQTELLKKVNTFVDKVGKDANGDSPSDPTELNIYKDKGVPGLVDYWHGQDTLKNFRDETGISTSTNAYKELKALYEDGKFAEADKRAAEVKKNDADRQKYNAENGTSVKLADWEKKYSGKVTNTTTNKTPTTTKVPEVKNTTSKTTGTTQEVISNNQKFINRAGKQSRKFTNDIPKMDELQFGEPEKYTYAYAINQDGSLTPEKFDAQFDKMNLNNNKSLQQDEMIQYFNQNDLSEKDGMYLWKTYGEKDGKPWKTLPVLKNGTWKKTH